MPSRIYFSGPAGLTILSATPILDTNIYAAGDTLFTTLAVTGVARGANAPVLLRNIYVIDKDDQKPVFDIYFFDRTVTFGAFNVVPAISNADAGYCQGYVSIAAGDYKDLGGVSVAKVSVEMILQPLATSLFIAGVNLSGTPTHTAAGLVLKFGIARE